MTYKTRLDYFHYAVTVFYFLFCALLCLFVIFVKASPFYVCLGYIFLFIIALLAYLFYDRKYIFNNKDFVIKMGIFSKNIKYKDIKKCYITKNYHLSYATSRRRICIETKDNKKYYISPKNMDEVLMLLITRR